MENIKEKIMKNKKIIYLIIAIIILAGLVSIYVRRLNFTLMYDSHTRIDVYAGKDIDLGELKEIAKEVFGNVEIQYQRIETFNDSVAMHIKEVTQEQASTLKEKLKEKYELGDTEFMLQFQIPHVRARDLVKPYLIPTIIVTLIIMGYVGVRYMKLGAMKTMVSLLAKLVVIELLYLAIIGLFGIPIGIFTMPIAIAIYLITTMVSITKNQNELETKELESKKNNKK